MKNTFNNFKKIFEKFNNKKFYITIGFMFLINVFLFYMQGIQPIGDDTGTLFSSDLPMHFNKIYKWETFKYDYNTNYSIFHLILRFFTLFDGIIPIQIPTALLLAGANLWAVLIIKKYLTKDVKSEYKANLLAIAISIVTMLILPQKIHMPFFGIGSPNQWHNPTFLLLKPFILLSYIEFEKIFIKKIKITPWKFILWNTIAVMIKPSFAMAFIPGTLLFTLISEWKSGIKTAIKSCLKLFMYFLPGLIIFLGQSLAVTGDSATAITFMIGGNWVKYAPMNCVPYAILLANLFFICYMITNRKNINKNTWVVFLILICSIFEALLFGETGARDSHLNFLSPYYTAMLLTYIPTIKSTYIDKTTKTSIFLNLVLFLHIYSGFIYYLRFLIGLSYY